MPEAVRGSGRTPDGRPTPPVAGAGRDAASFEAVSLQSIPLQDDDTRPFDARGRASTDVLQVQADLLHEPQMPDEWEWQRDRTAPRCCCCGQDFNLLRRRHHCRPCGRVFCAACCAGGRRVPVRQCTQCRQQLDPGASSSLFVAASERTARRRSLLVQRALRPRDASPADDVPELRTLVTQGPPAKIFTNLRHLAGGSYGEVYRARDDRVGDDVAVKVLPLRGRVQDHAAVRQRIAAEVACHQRAVAASADGPADTPPFPRLHGVFLAEPTGWAAVFGTTPSVWLVMELVDGDTLARYLATEYPPVPAWEQQGPSKKVKRVDVKQGVAAPPPTIAEEEEARRRAISIHTHDLTKMDAHLDVAPGSRHSRGIADERQLASLTHQLLSALHVLHGAGIIFRDLKPDNILCEAEAFSDKRTLRLVDFGGAIQLREGETRVASDALIGSPSYVAPEAWDLEYSFASDVWAVGCVVYEMAMGVAPFHCISQKVAELSAQLPPETGPGSEERPAKVTELRARMRDLHRGLRVYMRMKPPQPRGFDASWAVLCWSDEIVDFVKHCLDPVPDDRWTCAELLQHPWIVRYTKGVCKSLQEADSEVVYARLQSRLRAAEEPVRPQPLGPSLICYDAR